MSENGEVICEWCDWCNPTADEIAAGKWDSGAWFCSECVADGHDHTPTDQEVEDFFHSESYPEYHAELLALREEVKRLRGIPPAANEHRSDEQ
jgi:hypothetical protein